MTEGVIEKIPNKIDNTLYCIYTNYEEDYTKPYTTILGCKVSTLNDIPDSMAGKIINEGNYIKYSVTGNILEGIVFNEWVKIWNSGLQRRYTADFEVYGAKAQHPENATVDIFVAIK